jgi:CheY-like chemotaxis protein
VDAARAARQPDLSVGRYVMLRVEDNGSGIAPDVLPHIFDPFFSTKQSGQGTGLGLASVYGIVTQSDGAIEVESTLGEGTAFSILFPRIDPVGESLIRPRSEPSAVHVLLVEDNDALREVTAASLTSYGYRVSVARTADNALDVQRAAAPIQLLVTDVHLRGSLGTDLARRLREVLPQLPVLYLSPFPGDAARVAEGDELLMKPFTADRLVECVQKVLSSAAELPSASRQA